MYDFKNYANHTHLFSVHELGGFVALVLVCLTFLLGVVGLFSKKIEEALRERHLLGGLVCAVFTTFGVVTGCSYYQSILDLATFP